METSAVAWPQVIQGGAKPPYPPPIDQYVENLYKDLRQGKFNHLTPVQIKSLATELADRVAKLMG